MWILRDILNMVDWRRNHQDVDFLRADLNGQMYFWPISKRSEKTMEEVMSDIDTFLHDGYVTSQEQGGQLYLALHHHPSGNCTYAYLMDKYGNQAIDTP